MTAKAEDDALWHRERDLVHRGDPVEALDQIAGLDERPLALERELLFAPIVVKI